MLRLEAINKRRTVRRSVIMEFVSRILGLSGAAAVPAQIFDMGLKTLKISRHALHGATRARVVQGMKSKLGRRQQGIILLQGGTAFAVHSTDADGVFRQESYFHYLFGVTEDSFYGALDVRSGEAYLFMPRLPENFAVWFGEVPTPETVKAKYAVQHVFYMDEMKAVLEELGPSCLHLLVGENTDSGKSTQKAHFDGISNFKIDEESLFDVITECRVFKTVEELAILQYCNDIASAAHIELLRYAKPGMMEYQLESIFLHFCYFKGGCRNSPYTPIAGSGPKAATLHYGTADAPNNREIKEGELVLLDMGTEYYRYGSDITVTLPSSGKFTPKQRAIYEGVLGTMNTVRAKMKPGVHMPDMHRLADKCNLEVLVQEGLLKGSIAALQEADIGALFMPHGLGHLLGIDTHDVGGYGNGLPPRSTKPGLKSLRLGRELEENMVITLEPGIYFIRKILEPAMADTEKAHFFNKANVEEYFDFGGIRLEDDLLITAKGVKTLTNVPRTVKDVECVMAGGEWPTKAQ